MKNKPHLPKDLYLDDFILHLIANHSQQDQNYETVAHQAYEYYENGKLSRADMFGCLKSNVIEYIAFKNQYKRIEKK